MAASPLRKLVTVPPRAFGLFLAAATLLASAPGLVGTWVYDDFGMLDNERYDDLGDVAAVFAQHSGDYLERLAPGQTEGETYRPITMVTLVAVHAATASPLAHHALGWALHLATAFALYFALGFVCGDREGVRRWLTALFALHPVAVEAYVWINGRSDVVAGLFLALAIGMLARLGRREVLAPREAARWAGGAALVVFAGAASKETFLPAVFAAGLATWLRCERGARARWGWAAVGAGLGAALYLLARAAVLDFELGVGSGTNALEDAALWARLPRLEALGAHALITLRPSAMESLAWATFRPATLAEIATGVVALAALGGLAWALDWGGVVYLLGAAVTLAPTVLVTRLLWLGLDRFLYLPLILVILAAAPHAAALAARIDASVRRAVAIAALGVLLAAVGATALSSMQYRDQEAWMANLVAQRPDDPTAHLFVARHLAGEGRLLEARARIDQQPPPPWPAAVGIPQILLAAQLRYPALEDRTFTALLGDHPDNALLRAHGMRWHFLNGRVEEALALAPTLSGTPYCAEVVRQLRIWSRSASDPSVAARLESVADQLRCPP